jgi:hypothetical protein
MNKQQRDLLAQAMVSQTQMAQMCADFPDSKRQFDEIAEALRAAIALFDKLPMTADGVVVTPGMPIYDPWTDGEAHATLRAQTGGRFPIEAHGWGKNVAGSEIYSTREAAEAAHHLANGPHDHDHLEGK